jgi:DNA-binding Lrp family transcriptional regulator
MSPLRPLGPVRVTDLDIDMLREMYPQRGVEISGIDPRLNANRIAGRLGVSRARVSARLRAWRDAGFVARYDVCPNPLRFGLAGASFELRVAHKAEKPEVIDRIALVPGAIAGIDYLGDWFTATFALPVGEELGRTAALLRSISGVAEVVPGLGWGATADAARPLSPLERRIVRALRRFPTESLTAIARHVGVSTRTITTRYGRLLDDRAVWFLPAFDFRALAEPVVSLSVEFATPADRGQFGRALAKAFRNSLEFVRSPLGPVLPELMGSYFVVADSAALQDDLERWVRRQPGVRELETATLVRVLSFPDTFDRLIASEGPAVRAPRIK